MDSICALSNVTWTKRKVVLEKLISCVLSAGLYFPPDARGWAGLGWAGQGIPIFLQMGLVSMDREDSADTDIRQKLYNLSNQMYQEKC